MKTALLLVLVAASASAQTVRLGGTSNMVSITPALDQLARAHLGVSASNAVSAGVMPALWMTRRDTVHVRALEVARDVIRCHNLPREPAPRVHARGLNLPPSQWRVDPYAIQCEMAPAGDPEAMRHLARDVAEFRRKQADAAQK